MHLSLFILESSGRVAYTLIYATIVSIWNERKIHEEPKCGAKPTTLKRPSLDDGFGNHMCLHDLLVAPQTYPQKQHCANQRQTSE